MAARQKRQRLDVASAAQHAHMGQRTIRARIADGSLPAYRSTNSRLLRIDLADLDAMIEGEGRIPAAHLDGPGAA